MRLTFAAVRDRLTGSALAARILSGSGWSIISSMAAQLIGLLTMIICARLLGSGMFGRLVILQTTLSTVGLFSGFGVGTTAIRYLPTHRNESPERIGHILGLCERTVLTFGISCAALTILFSGRIARDLLNSAELATPLAIALLSILFLALDGFYKSALIGLERIKSYAAAAIGGQLWNLLVVTIGAATMGLMGAAIGLAVSGLVQALISRILLSRRLAELDIGFIRRGSLREWHVLRDFALPSLLASAMVGPSHWLCQMFLAGTRGGFHQVALLGIAMQWFNAIVLLPTAAGRVLTPILVESTIEGDSRKSLKVLQISVASLAIVTIPCAGAIALAAPFIMSTYSRDFLGESNALRLGILAAAIAAIVSPVGNVLIAKSRAWLSLTMNLGWAIVYVSIAYALRTYGAYGVTTGLTIAYVAHSCWVLAWSYRNLT